MRTTHDNPFGYWIAGFVILWLALPVNLIDILIAPRWHAPNPSCDSVGIVIGGTLLGAVPWAVLAALISWIITYRLVRRRSAGADIFALRLGVPPWNWIVSLLTLAIVVLVARDFVRFVWQAAVPQTLAWDCGGRAETFVVTMRGPALQLGPFWEIAFAIWALHVRALLLSARVT